MASSNNAPQLGFPSPRDPALKERSDQKVLANFQEIFSSQIEADVVHLIYTECNFNENATLESLLSLIGESSGSKSSKQFDVRPSKFAKDDVDASSDKSIYKNRISTIYKSNESLYSEDTALNGEELNQFSPPLTPSHGTTESSPYAHYSSCVDTSQITQTAGLSLNPFKANTNLDSSPQKLEHTASTSNFKKPFPKTLPSFDPQAKWTHFSEVQDPLSPYSDKSIEADASEQIDIHIGQTESSKTHILQPSVVNCEISTTFDTMAGKQNKKVNKSKQDAQADQSFWGNIGLATVQVASFIAQEYGDKKPVHRKPNHQGVQQQRNTNKHVACHNPQAKKNPISQPHSNSRRQPHQHQKLMSPKENIMMRIADGNKVLVILRGCPGSGKSTLAKEIKFHGVIYSTDNFFMKNGEYCFDPGRLPEAHSHNKFLTMRAMQMGRTPIIIDNTNLLMWEMEPYVALALQNQYFIYLLEPSTPWRYDPRQLSMRNTHKIGYDKIVNMLQRFDHKVTVKSMIEQYNTNNRSANARHTDNRERFTTPNEIVKGRPHPRRNKKPKEYQHAQKTGIVTAESSRHVNASIGNHSSDSDTEDSESDESDKRFVNDLADCWNPTELNERLQKSKSVSDLMQTGACGFSIKSDDEPLDASLLACNISKKKFEPKLSENMLDLLDLDFSVAPVPPPFEASKLNQVQKDSDSKISKEPLERRRVGRLAAAFGDLPQEWEVPDYPVEIEYDAMDNADDAKLESRIMLSQEGLASSTTSLDQDLISVSKNLENPDYDEMPEENETDKLSALKSFFCNVPEEYLEDIFEKCNGNLAWVVNLLLDAGYEMCVATGENILQKSGSSMEGLAEITPDSSDTEESSCSYNAKDSRYNGQQSYQSSEANVTIHNEKMLLRIDPIFAMQLQETFGPVGFHLSPASYYGNDLGIFIPTEVARSIHGCWTNSLKSKFEAEEEEINKMVLDENYAKQLQEEEDHRLATTLQSDPLGEHFPPLETKHLLISPKEITPRTEDMASRIKRRQLYEMFPKIDRKALDEVFVANNASFSESVQAVQAEFNPNQKPKTVIATEQLEEYEQALVKFALQESLLLDMERRKTTLQEEAETDYSEPSYADWRGEATLHYRLRQECYSKAKAASDKGMMAAASFYSQQGRAHSQKLHEANKRASEKILESRNANSKADTLDLHMLHVNEAINALAVFLEVKKKELQRGNTSRSKVRIITGKGNHSAMGKPRIKPAVLSFLARKKFSYCESNAGLIEVIICK